MSKPTILLYRSQTGWIAHFPLDSEEAKLMGTQEIPTAFTLEASPERVLETIQNLNPFQEVKLSNGWDLV